MPRLLFPLLSIAAAIALFFVYLKPTYGEIGVAREEAARLQTTLDSAREIQSVRDRLQSKYNAIPASDLERLGQQAALRQVGGLWKDRPWDTQADVNRQLARWRGAMRRRLSA